MIPHRTGLFLLPMALWFAPPVFGQFDQDAALMAPHRNPRQRPFGLGVSIDVVPTLDPSVLSLKTQLTMPYGGYVISALSAHPFTGKFQFQWRDTNAVEIMSWLEDPPSEMGYERFDQVLTPMLFSSTSVETELRVVSDLKEIKGDLFFVLEPQCVAYVMPFALKKTNEIWSIQTEILRMAW